MLIISNYSKFISNFGEILELSKKFMNKAYILLTKKLKVKYKMFKLMDPIKEKLITRYFLRKSISYCQYIAS